jgi:hypothetical protein
MLQHKAPDVSVLKNERWGIIQHNTDTVLHMTHTGPRRITSTKKCFACWIKQCSNQCPSEQRDEHTELVSPWTDRYSWTLVHDHALFTAIIGDKSPGADHGGHTVWSVELRPLTCWNYGLESRREYECICLCCKCCVLSGRGLCDGPVTLPEQFYRLCVWVWSSNHKDEALALYDWRTMKRRRGGGGTHAAIFLNS